MYIHISTLIFFYSFEESQVFLIQSEVLSLKYVSVGRSVTETDSFLVL